MVRESAFRTDLFYRLHVFPMTLPALRKRPDDIPALVQHFVDKFGQHVKQNRAHHPPGVDRRPGEIYSWPGNIRELETFLERAVNLSQGTTLDAPPHELILKERWRWRFVRRYLAVYETHFSEIHVDG